MIKAGSLPRIAVVVGTYGDREVWSAFAQRAFASIDRQTRPPDDIRWIHGETLAQARNAAIEQCRADHVIVLDADDELDVGYLQAMAKAVQGVDGPVLCQPATLGVVDGVEDDYPVMIQPKGRSLRDGNHLVIGTMFRRDQFLRLGGYHEHKWEDWCGALRMSSDGARELQVPEAIYRVHVRVGSRNDISPDEARVLYRQIRQVCAV